MTLEKLPRLPRPNFSKTVTPSASTEAQVQVVENAMPEDPKTPRLRQLKESKVGQVTASAKSATVNATVFLAKRVGKVGKVIGDKAGSRLGVFKTRVKEGAGNAVRTIRNKMSFSRESSPGMVEALDGSSQGEANMALEKFPSFNKKAAPVADEGGTVTQMPLPDPPVEEETLSADAIPTEVETADVATPPPPPLKPVSPAPVVDGQKEVASKLEMPAITPPQKPIPEKPDLAAGLISAVAGVKAEYTTLLASLTVLQGKFDNLSVGITKDEVAAAIASGISGLNGRLDKLEGVVIPSVEEITQGIWDKIKKYMDGLVDSLNGELEKFTATAGKLAAGHKTNVANIAQLAGHLGAMTDTLNILTKATDDHAASISQIQDALF